MGRSVQEFGASFDARAERYDQNEWYRACAERLVELSDLGHGAMVLDAGTGTGFAAIAAARAVGAHGRVAGSPVDVLSRMIEVLFAQGRR
jgi:ubiquinone/menaquinone biosynthesis C-methylase UbiE